MVRSDVFVMCLVSWGKSQNTSESSWQLTAVNGAWSENSMCNTAKVKLRSIDNFYLSIYLSIYLSHRIFMWSIRPVLFHLLVLLHTRSPLNVNMLLNTYDWVVSVLHHIVNIVWMTRCNVLFSRTLYASMCFISEMNIAWSAELRCISILYVRSRYVIHKTYTNYSNLLTHAHTHTHTHTHIYIYIYIYIYILYYIIDRPFLWLNDRTQQ